ncbi:hypothetical protein PT277_02870 [Acetobacteraceae bacterium ESL0709]|nr:hypothetical protein [Acetobacteraceae bacterium ESL0697]MDF7677644.1 hypothetical protein [Acetobacteraceae bacterium ESL0709]
MLQELNGINMAQAKASVEILMLLYELQHVSIRKNVPPPTIIQTG